MFISHPVQNRAADELADMAEACPRDASHPSGCSAVKAVLNGCPVDRDRMRALRDE